MGCLRDPVWHSVDLSAKTMTTHADHVTPDAPEGEARDLNQRQASIL
jgi:hypothetical protein